MAGARFAPRGAAVGFDSLLLEEEAARGGGGGGGPEPDPGPGAGPDEELLPMVFLCAGCKRPVGDTFSWVANDEESGCILLSSASSSVTVDKEQKLSKRPGEYGCMVETLICAGCSVILGSIYRCTPKHLDYKRDMFCFSIKSIESYTLGSSEKLALTDKEPITLESRVDLEETLRKANTVLRALEARLTFVESSFASLYNNI